MGITRVGPKHQITIPRDVFERLELEPGDLLEVEVRGDALYAVPQKLIPRDQAYFWTKEWQDGEREVDEAIARGDVSDPFESAEDVIRHLRSG